MALSFLRDNSPTEVEALVVADNLQAFDELAHDLDVEFGAGQWELVPDADAEAILSESPSADFAVFAVSDEETESVERIASLIRLAAQDFLSSSSSRSSLRCQVRVNGPFL